MAEIPNTITEPFPIFKLAHHYLMYDVDTVSYVRRSCNVCGVLIGSLPQSPQQNVFLGLPLELMPEEARLLVEKGVAYLVDDSTAHRRTFLADGLSTEERKAFQATLRRQGLAAAKDVNKKRAEDKKAALKKKKGTENWNDIPEDMLKPSTEHHPRESATEANAMPNEKLTNGDEAVFDTQNAKPAQNRRASINTAIPELEPYFTTPTTSDPPLHHSPPLLDGPAVQQSLPKTPPSYPLFAHMHSKDYFLTPGLRFGCQYMAYPGDPLRFHSHFLCNGMEWDEEFDLLDLVGGGRLGTGVKKGFLIGGEEEGSSQQKSSGDSVRTFCVEWAGM